MKKYSIQPTKHTFVSLFNACANSPHGQIGLAKAKDLLELLYSQGLVSSIVYSGFLN